MTPYQRINNNRRSTLLALSFACCVFTTYGQQVDYKKIILPEGATNVSFEERLVQLAWQNNPATAIAQKEVSEAQYLAKAEGSKWTGMLGAQGNLNEFTIKQLSGNDDSETNLFFPRYNVYLNIPMSVFFEQPNNRKAARVRVEAANDRVNLLRLELRAKVLTLYQEYKKTETILKIRRQAMLDDESNYLLIEQKYKTGDVSLENYMAAQKSKTDNSIQVALAENDFLKAKIELEALIGVRIEEVR